MSNQPLTIKVDTVDKTLIIAMTGRIEEQFVQLVNQLSPVFTKFHQIQIDLDQLNFINSSGIREWVKMMALLKERKTILKRCPVFMIRQANLVDGFFNDNTVIESFYVSYYNEENDKEITVLYEKSKHYGKGYMQIPDVVIRDGLSFNIDVIREKYFSFLEKSVK
jgi:hypothetical protein